MKIKIIKNNVWIHSITGTRVTTTGACPWMTDADAPRWILTEDGFTYEITHADGSTTRGLYGSPTNATYAQAVEFATETAAAKGWKVI